MTATGLDASGLAVSGLPREQRAGTRLHPREREAFLRFVSDGATIAQAAAAIGRGRQTFADALASDPAFAAAYEAAYEASADLLEAEAWRRATTPDRHGKYSDRLLELLLRSRRPFRYRSAQSIEVTGAGGGPVRAVVGVVDARAVLEVLADAGLVAPELPRGS